MSVKSDAELALAEKIDLARTLVRFKARRQAARELNEAEDLITKQHNKEVADGNYSQIDLDSIGGIFGNRPKELTSGSDTDSAPSTDAD